MKKASIILIVLFFAFHANAQFNLSGGIGYNINTISVQKFNEQYTNAHGASYELIAAYNIHSWQPGIEIQDYKIAFGNFIYFKNLLTPKVFINKLFIEKKFAFSAGIEAGMPIPLGTYYPADFSGYCAGVNVGFNCSIYKKLGLYARINADYYYINQKLKPDFTGNPLPSLNFSSFTAAAGIQYTF